MSGWLKTNLITGDLRDLREAVANLEEASISQANTLESITTHLEKETVSR
jgi:hypothetical protein